ncbi:MAG TPA: DinB family protein [Candidatus Limnocylindria bacterium]|nr:DinB family protein [Candidatus Limnocylindria bacterium]
MAWPVPVEALWNDLQSVRAELLKEADGLSQTQADWRPDEGEWSVGEVLHHLTLAEVGTGKLTSKLLKEAPQLLAPFPPDLTTFTPVPAPPSGPAKAPEVVYPERGHPLDRLVADLKATRERSRQSIERLAAVDPRGLKWRHFTLGEMDLAQWWLLHVRHEADHLEQLRAVKAAPGFPRP